MFSMKPLKLWSMLTLIASALLLSAAPSARALQNEKNNRTHHDHPQQHSEPTQVQPPVLVPSPAYYAAILGELRAIVSEEVAKNKQEHADRKDWDTPAFWVSVVLAVVGAAYTVIAYRQLNAIGRQADIAENALKGTERAWLLLDDSHRPDPRDVDRFLYAMINNGRTPAFIKIIKSDVRQIDTSQPPPPSLYDEKISYKNAPDVAVVGPTNGILRYAEFGRTLEPYIAERIRENEWRLWFLGFAVYVDIFGAEHVTEWCRFWQPSGDYPPDQGIFTFP